MEIFAHDICVYENMEDGADPLRPVYVVQGKDWEGEEFKLYVNLEEARSLLVQLGYMVYESPAE